MSNNHFDSLNAPVLWNEVLSSKLFPSLSWNEACGIVDEYCLKGEIYKKEISSPETEKQIIIWSKKWQDSRYVVKDSSNRKQEEKHEETDGVKTIQCSPPITSNQDQQIQQNQQQIINEPITTEAIPSTPQKRQAGRKPFQPMKRIKIDQTTPLSPVVPRIQNISTTPTRSFVTKKVDPKIELGNLSLDQLQIKLLETKSTLELLNKTVEQNLTKTVDLTQTKALTNKWLDVSQQVLEELQTKTPEKVTIAQWLEFLQISPKTVRFNLEDGSFE
eukprot:c3071_g1_i2.p1 GENE.c3071_g1_i2~~c3071_g1_i2.p1  ORF type:complete len:274 (+),score=94.97 c3071_g1_i2:33-854(+)